MKYGTLLLPTLLEFALIACSAPGRTAARPSRDQRDAEIRKLRAEQNCISARLEVLQAEGHEFLPRGMGR